MKSVMERLAIIAKVYGKEIVSHTWLFVQHAWFKTDQTSVDDNEHTGKPTTLLISTSTSWL